MLLAGIYKSFYGLDKEPFNITPDPEFFFFGSSHLEALASLSYGIEQRKGFIALTGEVGVGKTTIIRSYLQNTSRDGSYTSETDSEVWDTIKGVGSSDRLRLIYVFHANVSFISLLKFICDELEIVHETDDSFELVNLLYERLIAEYAEDRNVVVIVDEAQNMPVETLENLRMLSNLETSKDKLIQIVLVGQPELDRMLKLTQLRQLNQRIAIRAQVLPLTKKESLSYIEQRLKEAGSDSATIFTREALKAIVKHSKGIPRIINTVCHNAMVTAIGYEEKPIAARIVREVIADIEGKRKVRIWNWAVAAIFSIFVLASWGYSKYWAQLQNSGLKKARIPKTAAPTSVKQDNVVPPQAIQTSTQDSSASPQREPSGESSQVEHKISDSSTTLDSRAASPEAPQGNGAEVGGGETSGLAQPAPEGKMESHRHAGAIDNRLPAEDVAQSPPPDSPMESGGRLGAVPSREQPRQVLDATSSTDAKAAVESEIGSEENPKAAIIIVKRGDHLISLLNGFYGFVDEDLIALIKRNNPEIKDADVITPGQRILFPALPGAGQHAH